MARLGYFLAFLLRNNGELEVNFSQCNIDDHSIGLMMGELSKHADQAHTVCVLGLDISGNKIGNKGLVHVATVVQSNTTVLRTLKIAGCSTSDEGVESLARALAVNKSLQELDISYNKIGDNGIAHIATALQKNTTLESVTFM